MRLRIFIGFIFCFCISSFKSQSLLVQPLRETNPEIAFASDTQAPLWVEDILVKSRNNRTATKMIFKDIIQRHPLSLFLLGDVVSLGTSNRAWKELDTTLAMIRSNGIKIYAALGNHEVMGIGKMGKKGQQKFQSYFPEHIHTGFAQIIDSVAVILLNSNFGSLSKVENNVQVDWYKDALKKLDKDPAVQYIITGCHHPPYSNSEVVGSSKAVQQKFVPLFMRSKKASLFLSGHSHAFEHFKKEGKVFLVIGGGGGLHQPLNKGTGDLTDHSPGYKPLFHYLTVRRERDQLLVSSYKLKDDYKAFVSGLSININLPQVE